MENVGYNVGYIARKKSEINMLKDIILKSKVRKFSPYISIVLEDRFFITVRESFTVYLISFVIFLIWSKSPQNAVQWSLIPVIIHLVLSMITAIILGATLGFKMKTLCKEVIRELDLIYRYLSSPEFAPDDVFMVNEKVNELREFITESLTENSIFSKIKK